MLFICYGYNDICFYRGRSPEWYNRAYGQMCTLFMVKLRNSFSRTRAEGPETKV